MSNTQSAAVSKASSSKAFKQLHPDNVLKKLEEESRKYLWALLQIYGRAAVLKVGEVPDHFGAMFRLAAEAEKVSRGLNDEVFGGDMSQLVKPLMSEFSDLPARLHDLSTKLESLVPQTWKPGQSHKISANLVLATASEFVNLRLGDYRDADLAQLFQQICPRYTSGDMKEVIRKNRAYMKKRYPGDYARVIEELRSQPTTEVFESGTTSHNLDPDYTSASSLARY